MSLVLKKTLAMALVCFILSGYAMPAMAQETTEEYLLCEVLVRANLREQPSGQGRWIMTVPAGVSVMVLEQTQSDYWLISYEGTEGYMYTGCLSELEYVTPVDEAEAAEEPETAVSENTAEDAETNAADNAAQQAVQNGSADLGAAGGGLIVGNGRSDSSESVTTSGYIAQAEVLANAKMRTFPSTDSAKILTLPQGAVVDIIDDGENGFTHIHYNGNEGYVFTRCISYSSGSASRSSGAVTQITVPEVQAQGAAPAEASATDTRRNVSMMAASTVASTISVTTTAAAMPQAVEQVQTVEQQELAAAPASSSMQVATVNNNVRSGTDFEISTRANMRQMPSSDSTRLATLPIGAQVTLLGQTTDGYTMVQYNGMVGYVLDSCVTDIVDISRLGQEPVLFTITAYCSCRICCGNYSPEVTGRESRTSTGTIPQSGRTIAVDPTVIPYGTSVHIDGMGDYIAEDCGGMVDNNHIDVYFSTHEEAVQFGVQRRYVTIN